MQNVEKHFVGKDHRDFAEIDDLSFKAKNLYNYANYVLRQEFIFNGKYISYPQLDKLLQQQIDYKALPACVAQQTLRQLDKNWKSFFATIKAYKINPSKFLGRPNLPGYLDKEKGRFLLIYDKTRIKKTDGCLIKSNIKINTKKTIQQVRIVPKKWGYIVEVVYNREVQEPREKNNHHAAIDLGVNTLAAITSDHMRAILVNGRIVKSINQWANKRVSELKSLDKQHKIWRKRHFRIENYFHVASRRIVDCLIENKIHRLVVGKNDGWKQEVQMRKDNKQNFAYIPFESFINKLKYKCELAGIEFELTEESYTSVSSYYDSDPLPKYGDDVNYEFSGKRKGSWYTLADGSKIHADVHGSLNIGRKVIDGIVNRSLVARPVKVNPLRTKSLLA